LEVRLYIGGAIAASQLDDPNALPRAVKTGRKAIELRKFGRGERTTSSVGLDSGRSLAPLEVRFRNGPVIDSEDALDDVGQFGWHRQRTGPAALAATLMFVLFDGCTKRRGEIGSRAREEHAAPGWACLDDD
jgi:hypothetical protein